MSCKHCEMTIHTSEKSAWWQGADYVDGIRVASIQAGDAACEHFKLYVEEFDKWNDETHMTSIPIRCCPWCGSKLGGAAMTSANEYADFSGTVECHVLEAHLDKLPKPDTLYIFMTRDEHHVRESVSKAFGNIRRVVIDMDGEKHEYDADALIALLEELEATR